MTANDNQVKIKLVGNKGPLTSALNKIIRLYPVFAGGEIRNNDNDSGCHVFITVPEVEA